MPHAVNDKILCLDVAVERDGKVAGLGARRASLVEGALRLSRVAAAVLRLDAKVAAAW